MSKERRSKVGLDVSVLKKIQKTNDPDDAERKGKRVRKLYNLEGLPESCDEGYYIYEDKVTVYSCPYSTYNEFRSKLFELVTGHDYRTDYIEGDMELTDKCPFLYIFAHGDNEGDFTGEQLKRTCEDFKSNLVRFALRVDDEKFMQWYNAMMRGFMLAVQENGAIKYH